MFEKELLSITFAQNMEIMNKIRFPQLFEMGKINIATSQTVLYNHPVTSTTSRTKYGNCDKELYPQVFLFYHNHSKYFVKCFEYQ